MSEPRTFIEACLVGEALISDVDDWVDRWHDENGAPDGNPQSISEFLGLNPKEYALWVERPESLRFALAARKGRFEPVLGVEDLALAARATNDGEAVGVMAWLRKTGRIS
jgi:hypothetical protein